MSIRQIIKLAQKLSDKYKLTSAEKEILNYIDNSDYHLLSYDKVNEDNNDIIMNLLERGLLRYVGSHGIIPGGFVLTSAGSHALGFFDNIDL